ncbi:MAG: hypothetical protein LUI05_04475 [Oscillospiraceae bacterium]|nr:hypothetical protein [Oscillospiraceae bacterium]
MENESINLDWLKNLKPASRTLSEIADEERENTRKAYGRLLTEEEVIQMVDEAREELRKKGEI